MAVRVAISDSDDCTAITIVIGCGGDDGGGGCGAVSIVIGAKVVCHIVCLHFCQRARAFARRDDARRRRAERCAGLVFWRAAGAA